MEVGFGTNSVSKWAVGAQLHKTDKLCYCFLYHEHASNICPLVYYSTEGGSLHYINLLLLLNKEYNLSLFTDRQHLLKYCLVLSYMFSTAALQLFAVSIHGYLATLMSGDYPRIRVNNTLGK